MKASSVLPGACANTICEERRQPIPEALATVISGGSKSDVACRAI